jgi:hypothetical protein
MAPTPPPIRVNRAPGLSLWATVVGGIHTPAAVEQATTLGNAIGTVVAGDDLRLVPEPPMAPVLGASLMVLGALHHRRRSRTRVGVAA